MIGTSTSARVLSIALLLLVLGAGFLMGLAWNGEEVAAGVVEPTPTSPEPERRGYMIDQVGLDAEQQDDVDRIVDHYRIRMRQLDQEFRDVYRPRQREIIRQTRDSLKTVLTPEQVILYDSLLAARAQERRERESESDTSRNDAPPRDSGHGSGASAD